MVCKRLVGTGVCKAGAYGATAPKPVKSGALVSEFRHRSARPSQKTEAIVSVNA